MKKMFAVMFVVAMAVAACGGKKAAPAAPTGPAPTEGSAAPADGSGAPAEGAAPAEGEAAPK